MSRDFRPQSLGARLSVEIEQRLEHSVTHNVIGVVPGRDLADEVVIYTAHWDHVGIGTPENGDAIYNGAIDNATGTAVLLELARAFASLPAPPRLRSRGARSSPTRSPNRAPSSAATTTRSPARGCRRCSPSAGRARILRRAPRC